MAGLRTTVLPNPSVDYLMLLFYYACDTVNVFGSVNDGNKANKDCG